MYLFVSSSFPLAYTLILILAFANFTTSQGRHSKEYKACSKTFKCGNKTGLSYPFYGLDRPSYSGHPGFELLNCDQYAKPIKMAILSQQFYVLGINSTSSTINVSRGDYYSMDGCPMNLANITIDFSIFQYTSANENLTLLYDNCSSACSSNELNSMLYHCPTSSTELLPVCYMTRKMMLQNNASQVSCPNHIFLPVHKLDYVAVDKSKFIYYVTMGAKHGFELKWRANNDLCQECLRSGGQCGHDGLSDKFFCFCSDESMCSFPGSTPNKRTLSLPKIIILATCTFLVIYIAILLICGLKKKYSSANKELDESVARRMQDVEASMRSNGSPGPKRYTYTDLKTITKSFKVKIGEGGYGTVYKGTLQSGQLVAVKVLKKSGGDAREFINDIASFGILNHVNVVELLGFCYEGQKRALVCEFMPNGSLDKFVYGETYSQPLAWEMLFKLAIGIARGIEYLHQVCNTKIMHFDIKPHNILLDEKFCPKISDFGLAKPCPQKDSVISMSEAKVTVRYIAPEVFLRCFGGVSYRSDVYSYGMLLLEIVGCRKKADIEAEVVNEQYFSEWIYEQLEERFSTEEMELQRKMILVSLWCVQTNPLSRPSMSEVVKMLEGTLDSLKIPPMASLSSFLRSQLSCSTSTTISP